MADGRAGPVSCACGQTLVDDLDPPDVEVAGARFPFRRHTDYVVCPACESVHRITELGGAEPVAREVVDQLSELSTDD
jgi:hypothetical protein